jgi:polysaccharide export outer membrane protein
MLSTANRPTPARIHSARRLVLWIGVFAMAGGIALLPACASTAGSISVEQFPQEPAPPNEYTIGVGDNLNVQVFNEPNLSGSVRVRTDGRITLTLVGELVAIGKTPLALQREIETGLKAGNFLNVPQVTVTVLESSPLNISVLGQVGHPGMQSLTRGPGGVGVAQALAAAGGLGIFAHKDRIYVVRPGEPKRIRFSYDDLLKAVGRGPSFLLRLGDSIVVE